jgi:hypothetical protein
LLFLQFEAFGEQGGLGRLVLWLPDQFQQSLFEIVQVV